MVLSPGMVGLSWLRMIFAKVKAGTVPKSKAAKANEGHLPLAAWRWDDVGALT
jgi:hypothetical protein